MDTLAAWKTLIEIVALHDTTLGTDYKPTWQSTYVQELVAGAQARLPDIAAEELVAVLRQAYQRKFEWQHEHPVVAWPHL